MKSLNSKIKHFLLKTDFYHSVKTYLFKKEMKKEIRYEKRGKKIFYLKKWYKSKTGLDLNLDNPQLYTEKQQWLKLNNCIKEKEILSDKYLCREKVAALIGENYLIPLLSIDGKDSFENANDIDFDKLPNSFVISCNHGSGMTIIVKDKSSLSKRKIKRYKKILNRYLKINFSYCNGYEEIYKNIKPKIIITKYLDNHNGELNDYKFMCFNGKPKFFWYDIGRYTEHKRKTFDINISKAPFRVGIYGDDNNEFVIPSCFNEMVEIAKKLSRGFIFVRIDLYNVDGKIYFGECTFSSGSGVEKVYPFEYNKIIGDLIKIN